MESIKQLVCQQEPMMLACMMIGLLSLVVNILWLLRRVGSDRRKPKETTVVIFSRTKERDEQPCSRVSLSPSRIGEVLLKYLKDYRHDADKVKVDLQSDKVHLGRMKIQIWLHGDIVEVTMDDYIGNWQNLTSELSPAEATEMRSLCKAIIASEVEQKKLKEEAKMVQFAIEQKDRETAKEVAARKALNLKIEEIAKEV